MGPTEIELFLDVSCPWCHGSLKLARRLLDQLAADPSVPALQLTWRFLRLHAMPRTGGMPLAEYAHWDEDELREYAVATGVRIDPSRYTYLYDPFTAHRLLAAVRDDRGDDVPSVWSVARAVLSANFAHGVDVSDLTALRGAVERAGLAVPTRVWKSLVGDGHTDETLADHARALDIGLDGVPRWHVNGTIVPAWIAPAEVRRTLRAAIATSSA